MALCLPACGLARVTPAQVSAGAAAPRSSAAAARGRHQSGAAASSRLQFTGAIPLGSVALAVSLPLANLC